MDLWMNDDDNDEGECMTNDDEWMRWMSPAFGPAKSSKPLGEERSKPITTYFLYLFTII